MNGTPHAEDAIRIDGSTEPKDIRDFVGRRARDPIVFTVDGERKVIWSFTTHEPDIPALRDRAEDMMGDRYVIPYQVPGVWAYIQTLLPNYIREADLLVYSKNDGRYKIFTNFQCVSDSTNDEIQKKSLKIWLKDEFGV